MNSRTIQSAVRSILPKLVDGYIESPNAAFRWYQSYGFFLAKVRGSSRLEAIKNASVYAQILSSQQNEIIKSKFPRGNITESAGNQ
jgi:hypothetical protein